MTLFDWLLIWLLINVAVVVWRIIRAKQKGDL